MKTANSFAKKRRQSLCSPAEEEELYMLHERRQFGRRC